MIAAPQAAPRPGAPASDLAAALVGAVLLCAACPAPQRPVTGPGPAATPGGVPALSEPERARQMELDLSRVTSADPATHRQAYGRLAQRARDGDRAARTVQLVLAVRDALREGGCGDAADRQALRQQLELLELQLRDAPPGERVFAGPTLLLGLQAAGRAAEEPRAAPAVLQAGRAVWAESPAALGELLAEVAYALRLGCHLKAALPLLEEAAPLLQKAGPRSEAALLARRDLATLRFLLGDAKSAQGDLEALGADLRDGPAAGEELQARMEVVAVLRAYLREGAEAPPPRETGPGWQALRTVQQQASCPEATPADPRLLRVPVPPPACAD